MPFIVNAVIYECIVFFPNYEYHFAAAAILYECQSLWGCMLVPLLSKKYLTDLDELKQ